MNNVQQASRIFRPATTPTLALVFVLGGLVITIQSAPAQTYSESVLHSFAGQDGASPLTGLVRDKAGNMYGTTSAGGASGYGTVFRLNTNGKATVLHSFKGSADGATPYASVVRDAAGNLYGTTYFGGSANLGTVFKVDTAGKETVLHTFVGANDGSLPLGGLFLDSKGNLYGTTQGGGAYYQGTVFKVNTAGKETVLHIFSGGDGAYPFATPILDKNGNIYGTTEGGGAWNVGTVFKLTKKGKETVLYSFTGTGGDGAYPAARLIQDAAGNFYSTTWQGGKTCFDGCGTVFKVTVTGKETVLYSFNGPPDGAYPAAGLVRDAAGNFYGTTAGGGASNSGSVFKLDKSGTETSLYSFTGGADGSIPFYETLVRDAAGALYGTTYQGGASNLGTIFKLTP